MAKEILEMSFNRPNPANCTYCIHVRTGLLPGPSHCDCVEARETLGEETVQRYLAGGEHDCPFFEDDMLPW